MTNSELNSAGVSQAAALDIPGVIEIGPNGTVTVDGEAFQYLYDQDRVDIETGRGCLPVVTVRIPARLVAVAATPIDELFH